MILRSGNLNRLSTLAQPGFPLFLPVQREVKPARAGDAKWAADAAAWAEERLGFAPDAAQRELLKTGGRRVIINCTRQWGKSTVTAAKAVHHAYFQARSLTLVVSPCGRQSGEFMRKVEEFVGVLGIQPRGDGHNEMSVVLPNGSRMVGLPGSDGKARGFSKVSLLVVDEAALVPDALFNAVSPMLAVSDGDLWILSTPMGTRGFFYEIWRKGGPEWRKVSVPASDCGRIKPAFLAEQKERMGEMWFRQEYFCEFVDAAGSLFDRDSIEAAIQGDVRRLW